MTLRSRHGAVIVGGYMLGAALYRALPPHIGPVFTLWNNERVWLGRPIVAFLLPTSAVAIVALLQRLSIIAPLKGATTPKFHVTYGGLILWFSVFLTALHAIVLIGLLGLLSRREWADRIIPILLGVALIAIGNLLPRARPDWAIRGAAPATVDGRAMSMRAHRVAGYIVVAAGVAILLAVVAASVT